MTEQTSAQHLTSLQGRVRCYLKRLQEEEDWKAYCASLNINPNYSNLVSEPYHLRENIQQVTQQHLKKTRMKDKRSVAVQCSNSKVKDLKFEQQSLRDHAVELVSRIIETRSEIPKTFQNINKELVIKTPHLRNRLIEVSQKDWVKPKAKDFSQVNRPSDVNTSDQRRHRIIFKNPNDLQQRTIETLNKHEEKSVAHISKDPPVHWFQVPPTFDLLETFLWDKLLDDVVRELERIALEEAKRKKEHSLQTVRTLLRSLKIGEPASQELPVEKQPDVLKPQAKNDTSKKQSKNGGRGMSKSSTRSQSLKGEMPHSKLAKPPRILLNLPKESVRTILRDSSENQSRFQKMWPPVFGIDDFHLASIHVSDSILEEALEEVVQELEQISNHVVQSCFEQEVADVGYAAFMQSS